MADVVTWGEESAWKVADIVIASTNTILQATIVILSLAGYSTFSLPPVAALGTGLTFALISKKMANFSAHQKDCRGFILWHTWWHLWLPAGAIVGQLLLYEDCDWLGKCCDCCTNAIEIM